MKISKDFIKKLILEQMTEASQSKVSSSSIARMQEMKTELEEMADMLGPDADDMSKMALNELIREFETTLGAFGEDRRDYGAGL